MNVPLGFDFTSPLNPEVCWRISLALFHTTWQICILWILVYAFLKQKVSLHRRFQVSMACLFLAGCLPFLNYFTSSDAALPVAVSSATDQFDLSGSVPLFQPSELTGETPLNTSEHSPSAVGPLVDSQTVALLDEGAGYWKVSTSTIVTMLYLLGVAAMLLRLGQAIGSQHRLRVSIGRVVSEDHHPRLFRAAQHAASTLGRTLQNRIATFDGKGVALVFGLFQPVILVNASLLSGMTPQQLQHIFVHELAHIYRLDSITQFMQRVVESVLFYHPGVWWISSEVSRIRELCCDDVAARKYNSVEYADTLLRCYALQLSQSQTRDNSVSSNLALPMAPLAGAKSSQLASRIDVLLDEEHVAIRSAQQVRSVSLGMRFVLSAVFMIAAFTVLSSRSPAESLGNQEEQPTLQSASKFAWKSIEDIDDSVIEAPRLWFAGVRLALQSKIPDDITVNAMVNLESCQFAQWHFGDSRSTRVALLIEMDGDQINRVYLDENRDRIIEWNEELSNRIHGGKVWVTELKTNAGFDDDLVEATRQIAIYPKKDRVRIRTLGFAEGEVEVAGETRAIRRVDIDGDGIPVGSSDQVWVDLNSDSAFDPVSERFNMADQLNIAGRAYIVRSDSLGHTLTLTQQADVGYVKFDFELKDKKANLEMLEGSLRDNNGMLIAVRLTGEPISIPPGRYCLEELVVRAVDSRHTTWEINLSRGTGGGWIQVDSGETVDVPLLNDLQFTGTPVQDEDDYSGHLSHLKPSIYTGNGLVITELTRLAKGQKKDNWTMDRLVTVQASDSSVSEQQTCSGFN